VGYTAGTQHTTGIVAGTKSTGGTKGYREATDQEIIWYQVYGKCVDGTLAIG